MATPILGAPSLAASQAVPETAVNEIARFVEQGARWFVFKDRDLATPPGSPADGDCYLVAASATGAWAGQDGQIAFRLSTAWEFITPSEGMAAWVNDEDIAIVFDGSAWGTLSTGGGGGGSSAQHVEVAMSDLYSEIAAGTKKATWVATRALTLSAFATFLTSAVSSSGVVTVDVHLIDNDGTDLGTIFSTKPSIDANEYSSLTGTAAVLSTTSMAAGQWLRFDLDADGTSAKGLIVAFEWVAV